MIRQSFSLSILALAAALPAQAGTATFPSDHAAVPNGQSSTSQFPYSYGVSRIMAVYESWDLGVPAGRQITGITFRQDGTRLSYGHSLQLEVRMGQTEKTAANLNTTFDNNWFSPPTTVFGPALFTLPDLGNVLNPNPNGNLVPLTLTTPYTFDPSKNLLVEWRVIANTNGGATFNYYLDVAYFVSPIVTGPVGCQHSGGQVPELESRPTKVGGTWYCDLRRAPANQPAFWFINVGQTLQPQFPLAPLFPGVSPTCQGQVSPVNLFSLIATTNSNGTHVFSVPIPNNRFLNDLIISSQAVCSDFFSPGGLVVSNGDQMQIGIDPAMSIIYSQGNVLAATGFAWRNHGVVTRFDHN